MIVTLRDFDPETDFPRLAELVSAAEPVPVSAAMLRERDAQRPAGESRRRRVAVDESGVILGASDTGRQPWQPAGLFWLRVLVDPAWREHGIGGRLYADALPFALAHGAARLETTISDADPASRRFAERRGFAVERHIFESLLDVTAFDERPFAGLVEAVEAGGIRFFSLADLGDTAAARRRLYEVNRAAALDRPGAAGAFAPFDDFARAVFDASWYRADAQLVAAAGARWVGLAALGFFPEHAMLYHLTTGVVPAYRGRKIAQALKLLAIRYARRHGIALLRTNNDSTNVAMLAINRKLGYVPAPGYWRVVKEVASTEY